MNYIKIKFKDIDKIDIINVDGGISAADVCKKYNPDALMNLALYDMKTRLNITKLVDENKQSGYLFSDFGIGIKDNKTLIFSNYELAVKNNIIKDYVSGSPVLVQDSKINIDWGNKISTEIQGKRFRTAFGFNDTEIVMATSKTAVTLQELAKKMIELGCKYAINCDGGGSSHLQYKDRKYTTSSRRNPSWLLVKLNDNKVLLNKDYIVTANLLNIRSGSGKTYKVVGTYKLNDVVKVEYIDGDWAKTEKGWISTTYIKEKQDGYYNQNNYSAVPYPSKTLPNATVKSGGCGLCCSANVLKFFGIETDIISMSKEFVDKSIRVNGGTDMEKASEYIKEKANCNVVKSNDENELVKYIKNGAIAIANIDGVNDIFSTEGHYINIIGFSNGKLKIFDVGYYDGKFNTTTRKKYVTVGQDNGNIVQYCTPDTLNLDTKQRNPNYYIFYKKKEETKVDEKEEMSEWAKVSCQKAVDAGLIKGDGKTYGWKDNITLERFLVILDKLNLIK